MEIIEYFSEIFYNIRELIMMNVSNELNYIEGGVEMFEFFNCNPRIEIICKVPETNVDKYRKLCDWLYLNFKTHERIVLDKELKYLYSTVDLIENILKDMHEKSNDINTVIKLNKIRYKNNDENLKELIEGIKFEYEFFEDSELRKDSYDYLNRTFSWYKLKEELIENAINFLATNKIDLNELEFQNIDLGKYENDIILRIGDDEFV